MQTDFAEALLSCAKSEGLHCALETCGYASAENLHRIRPLADLFLFDLKETDPIRHREYTGVENAPILRNLRELCASGASIHVRLPIIPGLNDRLDHFEAIASLSRELPGLKGFEVMPYHRLGASKRNRFGFPPDPLAGVESPGHEMVQRWISALRERGVPVLNETQ